jgi:hypothetical protein
VDINVDVGRNLTSLVERLAQQIGTTADKVYPWYVQQAYLEGVSSLVTLSLFLLVFGTIFAACLRKADFRDHQFNRYAFMCLIAGAISFFTLLIGAIDGTEAARKLMNPNYYAVKMLTRDIGQLTGK